MMVWGRNSFSFLTSFLLNSFLLASFESFHQSIRIVWSKWVSKNSSWHNMLLDSSWCVHWGKTIDQSRTTSQESGTLLFLLDQSEASICHITIDVLGSRLESLQLSYASNSTSYVLWCSNSIFVNGISIYICIDAGIIKLFIGIFQNALPSKKPNVKDSFKMAQPDPSSNIGQK